MDREPIPYSTPDELRDATSYDVRFEPIDPHTEHDREHGTDPDALATTMGIQPLSDYRVVRGFDTSTVTDLLGMKLDANIDELIGFLNMMDIETTACCGGHRRGNRNHRPYIDFSGDRIREVAALFQVWKHAGGLSYTIRVWDDYVSTLRVEPPENVSVKQAQNDLRKLTEFLRHKLKNPATTRSIIHRARRAIGKIIS